MDRTCLNDATHAFLHAALPSSGHWSRTVDHLADGSYSFTATATDAAGNVSSASTPLSFTVDTAAPNTPSISDAAVVGGYVNAANDTAGQALSGNAEAGSKIGSASSRDSAASYVTSAASAGHWSRTVDHLAVGS